MAKAEIRHAVFRERAACAAANRCEAKVPVAPPDELVEFFRSREQSQRRQKAWESGKMMINSTRGGWRADPLQAATQEGVFHT